MGCALQPSDGDVDPAVDGDQGNHNDRQEHDQQAYHQA